MTDHAYFEDLIMAAVDGEITPGEEAELRAHLESCETCRAFMETMKAVTGVSARDLPPAPEGFAQGVMEAVRAAAPQKKKNVLKAFPLRPLALAAAAAVVLWVGVRLAPAFAPKGTEAPAQAETPQSVFSTAGGALNAAPAQDAVSEDAPEAAEPETYGFDAGREDRRADAAAEDAVSEEGMKNDKAEPVPMPGEILYTVYAGEELRAQPVFTGSDRRMALVLTADKPRDAPERTADYTVTAAVPGEAERLYRLWVEDGALVVKDVQTDAAGWSAAADVLEKILQNAE